MQLNRGKKSIGLNPMSPEGKEIFLKLLATADVFITNVRLKSLKKYGLDYESLAETFPKLICKIFCFYARGLFISNTKFTICLCL